MPTWWADPRNRQIPETHPEIKFILGFYCRMYLWFKRREYQREKTIFLKFFLERRKWSNCIFVVDSRSLFIIVYISYKNYDNKIGNMVFATTVFIKGISMYSSCDTWIKNIQLLE